MQLVDLSQPIVTNMPVYPGDPNVTIESALTLAHDGVHVSSLRFGTHTGTHLDAPSHVVADGRTVDQLDLALLQGAACILQLRETKTVDLRAQPVGINDLAQLPEQLPEIVCIATGWDHYFRDPLRVDHPYLELALAHTLWDRGARVLGVDTLSPDSTSQPSTGTPVHDFWLGNDGVIVENLTGLTDLPHEVHMDILPLPLAGLDGSPVRAVARYP